MSEDLNSSSPSRVAPLGPNPRPTKLRRPMIRGRTILRYFSSGSNLSGTLVLLIDAQMQLQPTTSLDTASLRTPSAWTPSPDSPTDVTDSWKKLELITLFIRRIRRSLNLSTENHNYV